MARINANVVPPLNIPPAPSGMPPMAGGMMPPSPSPRMRPPMMPSAPPMPMAPAPHRMSLAANPDRTPHPTAPGRDKMGRVMPMPKPKATKVTAKVTAIKPAPRKMAQAPMKMPKGY